MVRRPNGRRAGLVLCSFLATLAFALPAAAQGLVQGVVTDAQGQPVDGASVVIEAEGTNRHFDMKTNKKGEFMQIGLSSGPYKVTATKDKLTASQSVRISQGRPANAKLVLGAAAAGVAGRGGRRHGAAQGARRRHRRDQRRQVRRRDRRVHEGRGVAAHLLRVLLQHRLRVRPEEGLRQRRNQLQEGDRVEGRLRRCVRGPRQHLQRAAQVRSGGDRQRQGVGAVVGARRRRRRRGRRGRALQPGRRAVERRQGRRSQEGVRGRRFRRIPITPRRTISSAWRS